MDDIELAESAASEQWPGWRAHGSMVDSSGRRPAALIGGVDGRQVFVKFCRGPAGHRKALAERDGLLALGRVPGVRTPDVLGVAHRPDGSGAALALRAVTVVEPTDTSYELLAEMVARVHSVGSESFGFDTDNFIGDFPQRNQPRTGDWGTFLVEHRLRPMAERAGELGRFLDGDLPLLDRAFTSIRERFQGGSPSLLHGDLWPGNVLFDADGPLLIDPAVSFGHHEMDIAFGQMAPHTTFPPAFYAAYERRRPSAPGYAGRRPAWQLWPLLTHLVQDGDGWRSQLMEAIEEIVDG